MDAYPMFLRCGLAQKKGAEDGMAPETQAVLQRARLFQTAETADTPVRMGPADQGIDGVVPLEPAEPTGWA